MSQQADGVHAYCSPPQPIWKLGLCSFSSVACWARGTDLCAVVPRAQQQSGAMHRRGTQQIHAASLRWPSPSLCSPQACRHNHPSEPCCACDDVFPPAALAIRAAVAWCSGTPRAPWCAWCGKHVDSLFAGSSSASASSQLPGQPLFCCVVMSSCPAMLTYASACVCLPSKHLTQVRHLIEDFWKDVHLRRNYQLLYTPHIAKVRSASIKQLRKGNGEHGHTHGELQWQARHVRQPMCRSVLTDRTLDEGHIMSPLLCFHGCSWTCGRPVGTMTSTASRCSTRWRWRRRSIRWVHIHAHS